MEEVVQEDMIFEDFLKVRKNKVACLNNLVEQAHAIERDWEKIDDRMIRLMGLRKCLCCLEDHPITEIQELSRLCPKMKNLDYPLNHFLGLFLPIERKYSRGLSDHQFLVVTELDKGREEDFGEERETMLSKVHSTDSSQLPLVVILDNLRSAFNVGSIFRTAECVGVRHIFLCGYTATPLDAATKKATMGSHVSWSHHRSFDDVLVILKGKNIPVIALETVPSAQTVFEYAFPRSQENSFSEEVRVSHDDDHLYDVWCGLLLGNERYGLQTSQVESCEGVVNIPCVGKKNSLNVGVAFGICVYAIRESWKME